MESSNRGRAMQFRMIINISLIFMVGILSNCDDPVFENLAPEISITAPVESSLFFIGDTVSINVDASDPEGDLIVVNYYINGSQVGSSQNQPYQYDWDTNLLDEGQYIIEVEAVDAENEIASSSINVTLAQFAVNKPGLLPITRIDQTTNYIDWSDVSDNEEGFVLERKVSDGSWSQLALTETGVTGHTDADLVIDETYTYRVKAINQRRDSRWSLERRIYMPLTGFVTDIDSNEYGWVRIGNQTWMAENLRTIHYRDGSTIREVTDDLYWSGTSIASFCYYENNPDNAAIYGVLYNWSTTVDVRGLAPEGWHVPSDEEWMELESFLGMSESMLDYPYPGRGTDQGKKLKTTSGWNDNGNGTDEFGFSALPSGSRDFYSGVFGSMGYFADFWTTTEYNLDYAWVRGISYSSDGVNRHVSKRSGYSVRCVKD